MATGTDLMFDLMTAPQEGARLVFGRVDEGGRVYLDPGDAPLAGTPVSLVPLRPATRFAALKDGGTLVIVGIIGGGDSNPSGTVLAFSGSTVPTGYLLLNGQAVSRTTYAALFAIISTTFGAGDGSTTFNLPDCRGRVLVGVSTDSEFSALGKTGGSKTHTLTIDQIPSHSHAVYNSGSNIVASGSSIGQEVLGSSSSRGWYTGGQGGDGSHNNLQPFIAMNYIVRI